MQPLSTPDQNQPRSAPSISDDCADAWLRVILDIDEKLNDQKRNGSDHEQAVTGGSEG